MTVAQRADVLDTEGMLDAAARLPEQMMEAAERARGLDSLPEREEIENVVFIGMGGSAIAGDILVNSAGPYLPVPVLVFRSYHVPAFVGEGSLVFAVSFSGNTEETIEAVSEAALQGARIVAITRGGELAHRAASWDATVIGIPDGIPQPRAGVGALAVPPLVVLEEMGLFPGASHWIELAAEQATVRRDRLARPGNHAEDLARRIGRTLPLVYGGGGLGAVAAHRWKTQINENAKVPAFWNTHPELCHNEVVGWGQHGDLTRQAFTCVNLRHDFEHPQVMERFRIVSEIMQEVVSDIHEVQAEGEGELAQMLDLMLFGDFVSIHLALQEGIDPGPVPVLDEIKAALRGTRPEGEAQ
ncbi:MAG: bifunctional phosphoglucose/phosphomannose isomerase [Acidimicrobiales bacterium]